MKTGKKNMNLQRKQPRKMHPRKSKSPNNSANLLPLVHLKLVQEALKLVQDKGLELGDRKATGKLEGVL